MDSKTDKTPTPRKAKFTPKAADKDAAHVIIDKPVWDKGTRMSTPYKCTFTSIKEWTDFVLNPLGFSIEEVLYLPKGFPTVKQIQDKLKK